MQWWLNVFFLINGVWVPGHQLDGWSPRPYETKEECVERRDFAIDYCHRNQLEYKAAWICSPEKPLAEPPEELQGIRC